MVEVAGLRTSCARGMFRAQLQKQTQQGRYEPDTLWLLSATSCHLEPTQFLSGHHQLIVVMLLSCTVQSWLTFFPSTVVLGSWRILPLVLGKYQLEEFVLLVPSHEAMQIPGSNWAAAVVGEICLSDLYLPLDRADQAQRLSPWNGSGWLPAAPALSCQVHPSTAQPCTADCW